ncbi:hypothetical protein [Phenylobacterium sp.]|uniref:hypothetical protein n=1 Tax=Phenylobacterium sp. TaxID=1871053 RepID=UPI0025D03968|nr:hypothetical protein [Phenylobacterium sp.]
MASTFKNFAASDVATTRTLLHEAIPVTGTIVSGTYKDENIKYFSSGLFTSVFDYPFLSSSANHIFDITAGYASDSVAPDESPLAGASSVQNQKKINIYNQFAQVLVGSDVNGNIQKFDQDGNITAGGTKMNSAFFISFGRLLSKDEIKKGSFTLSLFTSNSLGGGYYTDPGKRSGLQVIGDYGAATSYFVNSPTGEYALLYTGSADAGDTSKSVGHLYYQAGVAVITSSIFPDNTPTITTASLFSSIPTGSVEDVFVSGTIDECANIIRYVFNDLNFNNTTELNSTIYFCRANTSEYNYSSNPTYLNSSKIVVKGENAFAEPVSYITTVGLYSADNELLAVAKLSEPLKKTPSNEVTLRVRLDY